MAEKLGMWKITLDIFLFIGIIASTDVPVNASSCPLEMNPPSVVARYGDAVSVNCSTTSSTDHGGVGMGWEAEIGAAHFEENVTFVTWMIETLNVWEIEPECYIKFPNGSQCGQTLSVTVYKEPDSVSISQSNHTGPMVEGTAYQLQCDVISVAPVRNLTVIWYKEQKPIHMQSYDNLTVSTPVDESSTLTISPHRDDNGALIYCEAQMNLGPSGPNYFPMMRSKSHVLTVYYPPPTFLSSQTETPEFLADKITSGDQSVITTSLFPVICNDCNNVGIETKQFIVDEAAGSHPGAAGTTARIVVVFLALNCLVSVCVVYHKRKNTPVPHSGSEHLKQISFS